MRTESAVEEQQRERGIYRDPEQGFLLIHPQNATYFLKEIHPRNTGNMGHLKMDGWKTTFLLGRPIFRKKTVSFREGPEFLGLRNSLGYHLFAI